MRFDVLTLFPEMFAGYLGQSLLKLAIQRGLVDVSLWNIRDWATDKHQKVDDRPFGGGAGMVLMVEPVVRCVEQVLTEAEEPGHVVLLTPQGQRSSNFIDCDSPGNSGGANGNGNNHGGDCDFPSAGNGSSATSPSAQSGSAADAPVASVAATAPSGGTGTGAFSWAGLAGLLALVAGPGRWRAGR